MTLPLPGLPEIERRLRRAKLPAPLDDTHQYALRRALLASSYFPDSNLAAWRRRLLNPWRRPAQWATAVGSMGMGAAFAAVLLATPAREASGPPAAVVTVEAESTPTLAQTLQTWQEHGAIRYARQEPNGERIYTLHLENGNQIELRDRTPFSITVASTRR